MKKNTSPAKLRIKTNIKAGPSDSGMLNHNETQLPVAKPKGLRVKTHVQAGPSDRGMSLNHNETQLTVTKPKG